MAHLLFHLCSVSTYPWSVPPSFRPYTSKREKLVSLVCIHPFVDRKGSSFSTLFFTSTFFFGHLGAGHHNHQEHILSIFLNGITYSKDDVVTTWNARFGELACTVRHSYARGIAGGICSRTHCSHHHWCEIHCREKCKLCTGSTHFARFGEEEVDMASVIRRKERWDEAEGSPFIPDSFSST